MAFGMGRMGKALKERMYRLGQYTVGILLGQMYHR